MKFRFLLTIFLVIASLYILVATLGKKNQSTSIRVLDLKAFLMKKEKFENREIRLRGFVKADSILRHSLEKTQFVMEQDNKELLVYYVGKTQLPDTFADGAPIRADGKLNLSNQFISTRIEAKCASKYEAPHNLYQDE